MSSTETKKDEKPIVQSKDYRTVFASAFRMRVSDNDVTVSIAAEYDDIKGNPFIQDEVRLVMTHRSAKVLMLALNNIITVYESQKGQIQLPPGKEEEIAKSAVKISTKKSSE